MTGSTTMRAAAIDAFGPAQALQVRQLPRPEAAAQEVLVRVINAGVQLTDAAIRAGWTPPGATIAFPQVLGNEFAGVVASTGPDVAGLRAGDPVLGFRVLGCYAEYVTVPATQLVGKPAAVAWEQAGSLSASGQTAHTALAALQVASDETVVVHGAAGGVGSMFTQLARLRGATVIGTASAGNHAYLQSLGAIPVEYGPNQLNRIRAAAGGRPVAAAFDAAGHDNLRTGIELVADRSRVATIIDMALAEQLGCRVVRSRRSAARLRELVGLVAAGDLTVYVRRIYPLEQAAAAHQEVETGHGRGKVVLAVGTP